MVAPRCSASGLLAAAIVVAALAGAGLAAWTAPRPALFLVILAGQSNAQGLRTDAAGLTVPDVPARFWWRAPGYGDSGDAWTRLGPQPGEFPAGYFGPEMGLAAVLGARLEAPLAIHKFALTATSLARDWRPGADDGLFARLLADLDAARAAARAQGLPLARPLCAVWVQGESDAETPAMAQDYAGRLEKVVAGLRAAAGDPDLPVVLGVDEQHPWIVARPAVLAAQKALAAADPRIAFTSMIGLPKVDTTHLTAAGTLEQGRRIAEACLALQDDAHPSDGAP